MLVMETEYAWELFSDLKYVTKLAQENIKKAQTKQKFSYDKSAKEPTIKVNNLVMLKVEPRFKLHWVYQGMGLFSLYLPTTYLFLWWMFIICLSVPYRKVSLLLIGVDKLIQHLHAMMHNN